MGAITLVSYCRLSEEGLEWQDEACVRDGNLISSRVPSDLPDFNRNMIAALAGK
ncbi:MAG: DJ-1/PfpI family protein [Pseudomonadales bacterium]